MPESLARSYFSRARGHNLAVATRVTCEEAVALDHDLTALGNDVWGMEARAQLEARFVALEEAEHALHLMVTALQDIVDDAATRVPRSMATTRCSLQTAATR